MAENPSQRGPEDDDPLREDTDFSPWGEIWEGIPHTGRRLVPIQRRRDVPPSPDRAALCQGVMMTAATASAQAASSSSA